jgi:hypothetical protein
LPGILRVETGDLPAGKTFFFLNNFLLNKKSSPWPAGINQELMDTAGNLWRIF